MDESITDEAVQLDGGMTGVVLRSEEDGGDSEQALAGLTDDLFRYRVGLEIRGPGAHDIEVLFAGVVQSVQPVPRRRPRPSVQPAWSAWTD